MLSCQKESSFLPSKGEILAPGRVGTEILASLNNREEEEEEGGLVPPPTKRPRLSVRASIDKGEPSSSILSAPGNSSERSSAAAEKEEPGSGGDEVTSSSGSAMQSNGGVVHENGTNNELTTINGLGGVVKSNGCDGEGGRGYVEDGEGEADQRGRVHPRKKKPPTKLSGKDADIIRLIGLHLREMGLR